MKKRILIIGIALLAFVATFAVCQAVTGNNWVGYAKVQLPPGGQFTMVGVNFEAVGGGGIPLNEFISTNSLTSGAFPSLADNVFIYDPVNVSYSRYYYSDGTFKDFTTKQATNPVVYPGDAFWLKSSSTSIETNEIFLMGEVVLDGSIERSMVGNGSFQLIGNPYATDMNVNSNENWLASGATGALFPALADNLFVWTGSGYDRYYLGTDGKWRDFSTKEIAEDAVIPVGYGAWYKAAGSFTNELFRPFAVQ